MKGPRKIIQGQSLAGIPASGWNAFVDTHHIVSQMRDRTNGPANSSTAPEQVAMLVINDAGEDLTSRFPIVRLKAPAVEPEDTTDEAGVALRGVQFKADKPDTASETDFVVVQGPVKEDESASAVIQGATWCLVNVTDAGHGYAKAVDGDADKLVSATAGVKILWKPTGTGEKLCVVKIGASTPSVRVYEFRNCETPSQQLYLDNAEIADHEPGEVAVIARNGVYECWRLYGPASFCKTGECALILSWGANCSACSVCFNLWPCGGGSPTTVRGTEWFDYLDRVVKLDGPGHEGCYTVAKATGCFSVNDELTVDHIVAEYENCDGCGCYELTNCDDSEEIIYVDNDLRKITGDETGAATIGKVIKFKGVCWTITAFASPCGTTPTHWDYDWGMCGFGLADPFSCPKLVESCSGCCYLFTPCEGQEGDPEVKYYRLSPSDTLNPDDFVNEDGTSNGRVVLLADDVCYSISVPESCPEEDVVVGVGTVKEEFDNCEDCKITCWERCDAPGTFIRTYSDMSDVPTTGAAVKRAEDGKCYTYESSLGTCGEPSVVEFTVEEIVEHADACAICQDPRVKLVPDCGGACPDCNGSSSGGSSGISDPIVTDDASLFSAVGRYVKVDGQCYKVEWTTDEVTDADVCFTGPYNSCEECAAAPSRLVVLARRGSGHQEVTIYGNFNVCGTNALDEC